MAKKVVTGMLMLHDIFCSGRFPRNTNIKSPDLVSFKYVHETGNHLRAQDTSS